MKLRVKIAVAANIHGEFLASGYTDCKSWEEALGAFGPLDQEQRFWVKVDLDIPDQLPTIEGVAAPIP